MRRNRSSASGLCLGVLAFLLGSCNQDDTAFGPQDVRTFQSGVSGRITDRYGHFLPGALVTAIPSGVTTVSAPDGSFSLSSLSAGTYRIAVAKDDYRDTMWLDQVKIGLSDVRDLGSLGLLYRFATVSGVVEDSAGHVQPMAGIAVEDQTSTAMAVSEGKFTLGRVEPGRVRLFTAIQGVGYGVLDTLLRPDDTLKGIRIRINRKGGEVVGRVVDSVGTGVAGANVQTVGGALHTTTADDGSFKITQVPGDGKVALEVTKGADTMKVTGVRVAEGGQTKIEPIAIQPKPKDSVSVRSGTAVGLMSDSVVTLVADISSSDTTFHIYRYLWNLAGSAKWDSTATNTLAMPIAGNGLKVGVNLVKVKIVAIDGRKSSEGTLTVRLKDLTPPVIKSLSPKADTTYAWKDSVVIVRWLVTDNCKLDTVKVNGGVAKVDSGMVTKMFIIPLGATTVPVYARDSSGNISRDSLVLRRFSPADTTRPVAKRLQPLSDTTVLVKDSIVKVAWAVSDDRKLDTIKINGVVVHQQNGSVTISDTLSIGLTMVRLWARDSAGNVVRDSLRLTREAVFDSTFGIPWKQGVNFGAFVDDRDQKIYRTIQVGPQKWMAENLNYANAGNALWYQGSADSGLKYGRLYNWAQAMALPDSCGAKFCQDLSKKQPVQGICPKGWHIPTQEEWMMMTTFLGQPLFAGAKLKSAKGWGNGGNGSDSIGFRALPSGVGAGGTFAGAGQTAYWWTSTEVDVNQAWMRSLGSGSGMFANSQNQKSAAFSVRCTEDHSAPPDTSTILTALSFDTGSLSPSFDPAILKYVDSVDDGVINLNLVTAIKSSANAVVSYRGGVDGNFCVKSDTTIGVVVTNSGVSRTYTIMVFHRLRSSYGVPWTAGKEYDSFIDPRDQKKYRTVKIGSQNWMAQNLDFDTASSWTYEGSVDSGAKYGRFYTWTTALKLDDSCIAKSCSAQVEANHQGICPAGWHLPTQEEWDTLVNAVGGASVAEKRLKSKSGWSVDFSGENGDDAFGFRALPGGYRDYFDQQPKSAGQGASWWSSSEFDTNNAGNSYMVYISHVADHMTSDKRSGLSVRCVQD